jgi:VIT1/CCC1 family predicted Fe2+/Mn2+ transporter
MPVAIAIKPALRKVLGDEAEAAFVDVLNQIQAEQRNGFERSIEMHLQAFREYLDRHLIEADAKNEKRFAEADLKNEKRFAEADVKNEQRLAELKTQITQVQGTLEAKIGQVQDTLEAKIAQSQAQSQSTLIRWMFAFFIGTIFSLASLLFVYFQLLVKVKP